MRVENVDEIDSWLTNFCPLKFEGKKPCSNVDKIDPVVYFTNILRAVFVPIIL
jgi:hypothetical protein